MPHGMLDPWFQKDKTRRLKSIRNIIYWHLFEKKIINNSNGLLFTSEIEMKLAKSTFSGYRPKNEFFIGYGIETPPIISTIELNKFFIKFGLNEATKYLLFLSRIDYKKGLDLLIQAYQKLSTEKTDNLPILLIAGNYINNSYALNNKKFVENDNILSNKIKFIGPLYGAEKWAAFYGCEAFILPSHQENFGIAVVEALACGKPVLISNKINIYIDIYNSKAGLIENDSIDGTYKNLYNFINLCDQDRINMGIEAVNLFKNKFEISKAANNFIEILKQ